MDAVLDIKKEDGAQLEKDYGQGPPPIFEQPSYDPNDDGSNGYPQGNNSSNALLAMVLFIGTDIMFFAGLIGSFIVFRFGAEDWPPAGQPILPLGVTVINTLVLLLSGLTMATTWRSLSKWNRKKVLKWLTITLIGGVTFLLIQGYEWVRLIRFGLTLTSGVYGATFYTIIGCHALHVLGAAIWLSIVVLKLHFNPNAYGSRAHTGIKLIALYWFLVVLLWPVLYGLVYLS